MPIAAAASRRLRRPLPRSIRLLSSSSSSSSSPPPASSSSGKPAVSLSAAKRNLRKERDLDKCISLLSSVLNPNSSSATSRYAVELVVKRLARSRRFSEIEKLLESRKKEPAAAMEPFVASIISLYGYARMIDHAVRTYDEMDKLGAPRTVISFNVLLMAFNHTDNPGRVPEAFSELSQKHGIVPDKVSYGILIKSLCQSLSTEKVYPILKEMEDKGIEITPVPYTMLLDALYRDGKVADAEKLWKEMESKGCSPDVVAYNVKIIYTANHCKPENVIKLIDDMVAAGIKPDTISYNHLITCYCKNGQYEDAKKVYKSLRGKRCHPNAATYRNFVFFLCKNGDFDAAMEVCMKGIKKDKVPDFGTMKMLVEGLVENFKLEEAKCLVKQVREKFPEGFMSRWKTVEEKLGLDHGDEEFPQAEAS